MLENLILREPEGPTVYAAKQQYLSKVEKRSQVIIWKTRENGRESEWNCIYDQLNE